jgi:hypothetical protein
MVELDGVSRAGFYRFDPDRRPQPDGDMDLRDAIQRIALEWPCYGQPKITAELRRRGWKVDPKPVYRLMREDNLLGVRKRKFVVTTDSNQGRKVYPNLAGEMVLTGIDQLWLGRHHLHSAAERVRLPGGVDRRLFAPGDWLGAEPNGGRRSHLGSTAEGAGIAAACDRAGASFRSWQPVRFRRLYGVAQGPRLPSQHESQGEPLGKRGDDTVRAEHIAQAYAV